MADTKKGLTRKQLAAHLGISVSTVRAWQKQFADYLEITQDDTKQLGGRHRAIHYSRADVETFEAIDRFTDMGLTFREIHQRLTDDTAPPPPEDEPDAGTDLVPWDKYAAAVASLQYSEGKIEGMEGHLAAVEGERDRLAARVDKLESDLDAERSKTWWQRLTGRKPR